MDSFYTPLPSTKQGVVCCLVAREGKGLEGIVCDEQMVLGMILEFLCDVKMALLDVNDVV